MAQSSWQVIWIWLGSPPPPSPFFFFNQRFLLLDFPYLLILSCAFEREREQQFAKTLSRFQSGMLMIPLGSHLRRLHFSPRICFLLILFFIWRAAKDNCIPGSVSVFAGVDCDLFARSLLLGFCWVSRSCLVFIDIRLGWRNLTQFRLLRPSSRGKYLTEWGLVAFVFPSVVLIT